MKSLMTILSIVLAVFLVMDAMLTYAETRGLGESNVELIAFILDVIFLAVVFLLVRKQHFGLPQQVGLIVIAFLLYWVISYVLNLFVLLPLFT